jgi:hypothetical protein
MSNYGSVTNNNGFWMRWLHLLTHSRAISLNHNQLQEVIINLQPNPSSLTDENSTQSSSRSTTHSNWTTLTLTSSRHGPGTENTALLSLHECMSGFPRDRYPANPFARWLLPSYGLGANHIKDTAPAYLAACLFERVYLATGFPDSTA